MKTSTTMFVFEPDTGVVEACNVQWNQHVGRYHITTSHNREFHARTIGQLLTRVNEFNIRAREAREQHVRHQS